MAKRRKRGGSLILRLSILCFVCYVAYTLVGMQIAVNAKRRELVALKVSVEQQTLENAETQRLLQQGDDETYVERIARDKLGFAYPEERVFIDRSGN